MRTNTSGFSCMLFDHAAGVFVLAQPDKLRMPNPTSGIIFHSGNGQACTERNSAGDRSRWAAVVWMARVLTRYRVKPVCTGRGRQNRSARFPPRQTPRHQGALHQSVRASSAGRDAENASEPGSAAFFFDRSPGQIQAMHIQQYSWDHGADCGRGSHVLKTSQKSGSKKVNNKVVGALTHSINHVFR